MKIITVIGARPQIIKAAAISREISKNYIDTITEIIIHTGQHYDQNMSEIFFDELSIPKPNYNLNVGSSFHGAQTANMIEGIEEVIIKEKPDFILLYGDTNSTLAGAVAASKINTPIVHVEAGLRSFNRKMPEEINRVVCDHLSTFLFSPTETGYKNLIKEGFDTMRKMPYSPDNPGVFHCGDIMYDNSLHFAKLAEKNSTVLNDLELKSNEYVLTTIHRDHNTDVEENLIGIFKALIEISKKYNVILPIHPRTKKKLEAINNKTLLQLIKNQKSFKLIEPVSFLDMIQLERNAKIVITDSGGVQKEAYFFNKSCIILRPETEWIEILETGMAKLVSANFNMIIDTFNDFISKKEKTFPLIFGDGNAAAFICQKLFENQKNK
jgi:UDP-GlcNAc3NAcA epimerase